MNRGDVDKRKKHAAYMRQWRKRNPDSWKASNRRYYHEHREMMKARSRRWRQENPQKKRAQNRRYFEEHREEHNADTRRWYKEHPQVSVASSARRRARKRALPNTLTAEQAEQLLTMGRSIYPEEELHLDHIVPINRGGGTTRANMQAIPAKTNKRKADKLPQEIYKQLRFK